MENKQLQALWQLAFGDGEEFIRLFFDTAYAPERCLYLTEGAAVTAALYWLDCSYQGQKQAYVYAVATHPDHRGKGLCRQLMNKAHGLLKAQGYSAALLRPADEVLRRMYSKMGYRDCTRVSEFGSTAGAAVPLRKLGPEEYAALRRRFLPDCGVIQEGASLAYLASYANLYAGPDFLLAGAPYHREFNGIELLGNREAAPGILGALGFERGSFRCPGSEIPFAMYLPLAEDAAVPGYLGLAFD